MRKLKMYWVDNEGKRREVSTAEWQDEIPDKFIHPKIAAKLGDIFFTDGEVKKPCLISREPQTIEGGMWLSEPS